MDRGELKTALLSMADILETNKKIATPELLGDLENVLARLKENPVPEAILTLIGVEPKKYTHILESLAEFALLERRLTKDNSSDTIIKVCKGLSNRPVILGSISLFL